MKAKVLKSFLDKENKVIQPEGKIIDLTEERFEQIVATKKGLIELVEDNQEGQEGVGFPKHTGGGWYELSNGEKVQGKDEAIKAEKEINKND